jgi:hypothetical protein
MSEIDDVPNVAVTKASEHAPESEQEISDAVIDAAIAAAEHRDAGPQEPPETADQPSTPPDAKPKPGWGELAEGADAALFLWRDKQVELFPGATLDGVLEEGIYRVQQWRDDLVKKRTGPLGAWGERAPFEAGSLGLVAGRLVAQRNKALAEVAEIRARALGHVGNYNVFDSRPDLLLVSPNDVALDMDTLDVQMALTSAGMTYVVIDGANIGESDAFYELFEKCGSNDGAFAAGTLIISRLDRMEWDPASIEQLRRYSFVACKDDLIGYWGIPVGARETVALYATYMAPTEEAVPRIIRDCFKNRLVIRTNDDASEKGQAQTVRNEAAK